MPGKLHEHVAGRINRIILRQLDAFMEQIGNKTAQVAKSIYELESADIKLPSRFRGGKKNKKSPDKSYGHEPCGGYPALVIEVAWSQRPLDLLKLAKRYIEGSKGRIRIVIGVDLEYQRSPAATPATPARFFIWRAGPPNQRGVPSIPRPDETVRSPLFPHHDLTNSK